MADNTAQNGSAIIAADEITSLNGSATSAILAQRVKNGYGDDGVFRDVSVQYPLPVWNGMSALAVTATAAAATAVTLTLPAAAGLFHYITGIEMALYSSAARTGSATPIVVTTTNLPGSLAYTWASAGVIGAIDRYPVINLAMPLKSSVVNTATTWVAPAVTGGIWRLNVTYFTGL